MLKGSIPDPVGRDSGRKTFRISYSGGWRELGSTIVGSGACYSLASVLLSWSLTCRITEGAAAAGCTG